jgi:hypothetical protein
MDYVLRRLIDERVGGAPRRLRLDGEPRGARLMTVAGLEGAHRADLFGRPSAIALPRPLSISSTSRSERAVQISCGRRH